MTSETPRKPAAVSASLPGLPALPEESWRRTDPSHFFLPAEEILSAHGRPVLESGAGLQPWKVLFRTVEGDALRAKIRTSVPGTSAERVDALTALADDRLALVIINQGAAEIFTTAAFGTALDARSVPFEATSVAPSSPIGEALAARLKSSSPQELRLAIDTRKADARPTLVVSVNAQPDFAQSYSAVKLIVQEASEADIVIADAGAAHAHHRHEIVVERRAIANALWMHVGAPEQQGGYALLERLVRVAPQGAFSDAQLFVPAGTVRAVSNVILDGQGAVAHSGAALASAGGAHLDYEPIQQHVGPGAKSNLKAKMLLAGRARGIFQGLVVVEREAQKTNALQENKNLVLSKRARIDAIPRLQILPDDVACKHGSATGELDQKQMYYLGSRGFREADAKALIVHGFLADGLGSLPSEHPLFLLADAVIVESLKTVLK